MWTLHTGLAIMMASGEQDSFHGGQDTQAGVLRECVSGGSHVTVYDLFWEVMPLVLLHSVSRGSHKGQPRLKEWGNGLHLLMANVKVLEDREGLKILQWLMPALTHSWLR